MEGGRDKLAGFSKRLVGKEKQVGVKKKDQGGVVTVWSWRYWEIITIVVSKCLSQQKVWGLINTTVTHVRPERVLVIVKQWKDSLTRPDSRRLILSYNGTNEKAIAGTPAFESNAGKNQNGFFSLSILKAVRQQAIINRTFWALYSLLLW